MNLNIHGDEERRSQGQMQGTMPNGYIRNIRVDENGCVMTVKGGGDDTKYEKTILCNTFTGEQTVTIDDYVTEIGVANYSEENDVTLNIDGTNVVVGYNIATEIPMNKEINRIVISGVEGDTRIQLVVKGVM